VSVVSDQPSGAQPDGLELRGVTITVPDGTGRRTLLDAVDLQVRPGEVVVVTGHSGSGKSTLLAVAGLLRRPEAGDVVVSGEVAHRRSERERTRLRRDRIAIVYQSANLLPTLTSVEQLEIVAHIRGAAGAEARRRATDLLDGLGLAEQQRGSLPAQLSGGERQRVGLARALMGDPTVLLADEPTASLDPDRALEVAALLADQTRRHGLATVIVTHDPEPVAHASRALHLEDGELRAAAGTGS
jgi:putative ABC transport system ATP-binding protein